MMSAQDVVDILAIPLIGIIPDDENVVIDFHILGIYLHVLGYHLCNIQLDQLHHLRRAVDSVGGPDDYYFFF